MSSQQERVWLAEYYQCWNSTEAARRANYKWPNKIGPAKRKKFAQEIEDHLGELTMSADEALMRLSDQARGTMADFVDISLSGRVTINLQKDAALNKLHLVKRLKVGKDLVGNDTLDIELYDAQSALKFLAQKAPPEGAGQDRLKLWLNVLIGVNNESMAKPGSEVEDVPVDGPRSQPEPGPDT
ncbi:MAG TPA: terminase small subunit [Anaerolineae bacterium]|jgi:hypothetical protein